MKILRVKKTNLFDIFVGDGWKNHARVYLKDGKLSFVGKDNTRLSVEQLKDAQLRILLMIKV